MKAFKKQSVVIVGAGPAGLTASAELIGRGFDLTILEVDPRYVGGLSRTVEYKGFRFDIGGHRFFSKSSEITQWWRNRLPNEFISVPRRSRILYRENFYDYPLTPLNALSNLGVITSFICVLSYLRSQLFPIRAERSFQDWVSNRFGRKLFSIFFKTYTEKVWGLPCSEISADWAAQRIKGLSLGRAILHSLRPKRKAIEAIKTLINEFEYPRLGPGMMWERTRDDLLRAGVRIEMGKAVIGVQRDENAIRSVRTLSSHGLLEDWPADQFIISMPLRDCILNMSPGFKDSVQGAARKLRYRDFIVVALILRGERLFPDNWIYIHDPGVRVGRVQNFNNWSPAMVPDAGVTCLGLEYFCCVNDSFWLLTDDEIIAIAKDELVKIGLGHGNAILDAHVVRSEKAYPVYDDSYKQSLDVVRAALQPLQNLQMIGRNGMHRYNNQDHSMMTGLLAARNLVGGSFDVWNVNGDAEYHEDCGSRNEGGPLVPERAR